MKRATPIFLVVCAFLAAPSGGCTFVVDFDRSLLVDAGVDSGADAGQDAGLDVSADASVDAGEDAAVDSGADAG